MLFFLQNLFKNLNSLNYDNYYICKNLFRLTWASPVSYLRVLTVILYSAKVEETFKPLTEKTHHWKGITMI